MQEIQYLFVKVWNRLIVDGVYCVVYRSSRGVLYNSCYIGLHAADHLPHVIYRKSVGRGGVGGMAAINELQ